MSNYEEIKIPDLSDNELKRLVNNVIDNLKKEQQIINIKSFDKKQRMLTDYYKITSKKTKNVEQKGKRTINIGGQEIELTQYIKKRDECIKNNVIKLSNKIKSKNEGKKIDVKDFMFGTITTIATTTPIGQCILSLVGGTGLCGIIYIEFNSLPEDRIKYKKHFKEIIDNCFTKETQKTVLCTPLFGVPLAIHGGVKGGFIYGTGAILSGVASVVAGPAIAGAISTWATWSAIKTFQLDLVKAPILSALCNYFPEKTVGRWFGTIWSFPIPENHFIKLGEALNN